MRGQVDSRSSRGKNQCPVLQTPLQLDYCSSRTGERIMTFAVDSQLIQFSCDFNMLSSEKT
jgi:hypothetical protein